MTLLPIGSAIKNPPEFKHRSRRGHKAWSTIIAVNEGRIVVYGKAWDASPDGELFGWSAEWGFAGEKAWEFHGTYSTEIKALILNVLEKVRKWVRSQENIG